MTVLLVMAKAPSAGGAKTRLCPPATLQQAAQIAAAALLDTIAAVHATPDVTPVLAWTGRLADAEEPAALAEAIATLPLLSQRGKGLAERLANAHADVAVAYPGRPVLQIGMDTPQLTPDLVAAALCGLDAADAVLGPAVDGGWWSLGLREPRHATALRGVPMSAADTGTRTRAALRERGLSVVPAPPLRDVDDWSDALVVAAAAPRGRFARQVAAVQANLPPTVRCEFGAVPRTMACRLGRS